MGGDWLARGARWQWRLTWASGRKVWRALGVLVGMVQWVASWTSFRVGAVAALLRVVAVWAFGKEHLVILAAREVQGVGTRVRGA